MTYNSLPKMMMMMMRVYLALHQHSHQNNSSFFLPLVFLSHVFPTDSPAQDRVALLPKI